MTLNAKVSTESLVKFDTNFSEVSYFGTTNGNEGDTYVYYISFMLNVIHCVCCI